MPNKRPTQPVRTHRAFPRSPSASFLITLESPPPVFGLPRQQNSRQGKAGKTESPQKAREEISVVEDVPENGEDDASEVDSERYPPDVLFVELLLKVLEDHQPDRQPGQGSHQVSRVAHRWRHLLVRIAVPDSEAYVRTGCSERKRRANSQHC